MDVKEIVNSVYEISEDSLEKLMQRASKIVYPKGFHIFESGKVETNVYLLEKGIVRAFVNVDGKEITFWIGKEGATLFALKSYMNNEPGYETIELLEESTLYELKRDELYRLYKDNIQMANWGRKLAEREFLRTEERLISHLLTTASERYKQLMDETPDLLQRVPLECLASYLGITPVSLSRIRATLKTNP